MRKGGDRVVLGGSSISGDPLSFIGFFCWYLGRGAGACAASSRRAIRDQSVGQGDKPPLSRHDDAFGKTLTQVKTPILQPSDEVRQTGQARILDVVQNHNRAVLVAEAGFEIAVPVR